MFTGTRSLHRCVQRENVGLEGDAVDHSDDVDDAPRRGIDHRHRLDHLMHHSAASCGDVGRSAGQLAGLARVGGRALHGLGQAFHRHSGFLQRGRLLLGTLREVAVALCDFGRADCDGVRGELDLADDRGHRLDQRIHAFAQFGDRPVLVGGGHALGQIALLGGSHHLAGLRHGALHGLVLVHLRGDVGGVLDDLGRLAIEVQDRVVGCLDPDLAPALAQAPILAGVIFAAPELLPELAILDAAAMLRLDKQRMVLPAHFVQAVAGSGQEIVIGRQDAAIHAELDHRLRFGDRGQLPRRVGRLQLLRGDVGRELDHLVRPPLAVQHRVVRSLDPDLAQTFAEAAVLSGVIFATPQAYPEVAVFRAARLLGVDEQGVMLALDLLQPVTHRLQEIVIGPQDGAVERELDDGLHAMQRGHLRFQLGAVGHRLLRAGALLRRQHAKQRTPRRPTGMQLGRRLRACREAWNEHCLILGVR